MYCMAPLSPRKGRLRSFRDDDDHDDDYDRQGFNLWQTGLLRRTGDLWRTGDLGQTGDFCDRRLTANMGLDLWRMRTYCGWRLAGCVTTRHCGHLADFLCNHSELLKVDETANTRVIAEMNECQVLLYQRKEWYLQTSSSYRFIGHRKLSSSMIFITHNTE